MMYYKEWVSNEAENLKKYIRETGYSLYTTIWANNGGGQGFYGLYLKKTRICIKQHHLQVNV